MSNRFAFQRNLVKLGRVFISAREGSGGMALPNIFDKEISDVIISRINNLTPESERQWGKMDVAQMLAHCCVTYETIYANVFLA